MPGVTVPASDALQAALALVIDPEIRRNVVELGMVDAVDVDGGHVHVTIRLTIPGCPLKSNLEAQVRMHVGAVPGVETVTIGFTHMDEEQRAALRAQLQGGGRAEGERQVAVEDRTRVIAVASGKGGVGKSSLTVNLALALRARGLEVGVVDADIYGYSIPGMLGHPAAPGRRRQDDRAARRARPQGDVDRLLPRGRRLRGVARADAAPRARAVPLGRLLGPARLPADRHAARAPATSASRSVSCCRAPRRCS